MNLPVNLLYLTVHSTNQTVNAKNAKSITYLSPMEHARQLLVIPPKDSQMISFHANLLFRIVLCTPTRANV